jgi:hypothetical protein
VTRRAEPTTAEDIEQEFPQWHAWKGVSELWYAAVKRSSPQILVRGEDPASLRDAIKGWLKDH